MKNTIVAALAASIAGVTAWGDPSLAKDSNGNSYRNAVKGMTIDNVAASGTYPKVVSIDPATGQCSQADQSYSGPLGPLADEISAHIRGPANLKRFAVYTAQPPKKKKRGETHLRKHRRHAHGKRHEKLNKRACGDIVTATYPENGAVFSFTWTEGCGAAAAATPAPAAAKAPAAAEAVPTAAAVAKVASTPSENFISGSWSRVGFYDAAAQKKEGITFMNNRGASGMSGGWTMAMGNSLSYAAADGCTPASNDTILADTVIPSVDEISIWSDKECGANGGDCGYYRPDTVAHHGFGGVQKAFVFEFTMPHRPQDPAGPAQDMPAIWFLNAQIPRTSQYGPEACKPWPGAGEADVFETLAPGEDRAIVAIHGNEGFRAGNVDYFQRPTETPIIYAAVFMDSKLHLKVLDSFDFGVGSGPAMIDQVRSTTTTSGNDISIAAVY
ncbi:Protein TOS1 [Sphaceloma murrayae]|uniref:glucan endo-1,3-beta-D-glucosidase n=1 Tax=Sphaceloma murrayae TaxID=2082308 RepID=A0A2K1R0P9_9PEZI|nr:Protein TOS1 [Sphaceloma murrayae]